MPRRKAPATGSVTAQDWHMYHGADSRGPEDTTMPAAPSTSKATDSPAARDPDVSATSSRVKLNRDSLGVEDLNLPRSMVQRLAKGVLPANTQIQKEALLAMSRSATVFVNYLASNANDRAVLNKKRTIQPDDVFDALDELEFPDFLPRVKTELEIWNTAQCDKRNSYRRRVKEEQLVKDRPMGEAGDDNPAAAMNGHHDGQDPPSKRARLSSGAAAANGDDDMIDDQDEADDTIDENEPDDEDDDENIDDDDVDDDDNAEDDAEGLEGDMDHNAEQDDEEDAANLSD